MKSALIVMALLGSDCGVVQCRYLGTVFSSWASVDACAADIEKQIAAAKVSYPLPEGRCTTGVGNETSVLTSRASASRPSEREVAAANAIPTINSDNRTQRDIRREQTVGLSRSWFAGLASWLPSTKIVVGFVRNAKASSLVRSLKANS